MVFRTNTAYDRWWEGRKKWGELVNNSRNLAIKISALTDDPEIRAYFKRMISNYVFAMKEHLREGVKLEELDLTEEEKKSSVNLSINAQEIKLYVNRKYKARDNKQKNYGLIWG